MNIRVHPYMHRISPWISQDIALEVPKQNLGDLNGPLQCKDLNTMTTSGPAA